MRQENQRVDTEENQGRLKEYDLTGIKTDLYRKNTWLPYTIFLPNGEDNSFESIGYNALQTRTNKLWTSGSSLDRTSWW